MTMDEHYGLGPEPMTDDAKWAERDRLIRETHDMLSEIKGYLEPLRAMAAGLRPMGRATMSPTGRDAVKRLRELA